jgi:hypothetical protein
MQSTVNAICPGPFPPGSRKIRHCSLSADVIAGRRLCRSHSQGREAGRSASAGADEIRVGDQSQDREGARPRYAGASGIDFGLSVVAEIAGETVAQAIQLGIEYDPNPPAAALDLSGQASPVERQPCRTAGARFTAARVLGGARWRA